MLTIWPSSTLFLLWGEHGCTLLIPPGWTEVLGLKMLCAAATTGPRLSLGQTVTTSVVCHSCHTTGTDRNSFTCYFYSFTYVATAELKRTSLPCFCALQNKWRREKRFHIEKQYIFFFFLGNVILQVFTGAPVLSPLSSVHRTDSWALTSFIGYTLSFIFTL